MSDNENETWKKNELYAKGEESDYVEEEKEAKRLQEKSLKRIMDMGLVEQDNYASEESDAEVKNILDDSDDEMTAQKGKIKIPESIKEILLSYSNEVKDSLKEIKNKIDPVLLILKEIDNSVSNPETIEYLENKKILLLSYISCLSYYIIHRGQNLINDYHPVVKKILSLKSLINKLNDDKLFTQVSNLSEKVMMLNENSDEDENQEEEEEKEELQVKAEMLLNKKRKNLENKDKDNNEEKYKMKDKQQEIKQKEKLTLAYSEIDKKNKFAIEKANKELAKGKGMYRKRKQKQGNARLMNKLKFQKKDKIRKRYVQEFTEAPLVYTGQATGIRRDLSRSVKIKN